MSIVVFMLAASLTAGAVESLEALAAWARRPRPRGIRPAARKFN